jgi:hypothetical protein
MILIFKINVLAILKLNSAAKMDVAFRNCGCVILTMIVVMTQMNQLTCVVRETVQLDGNVAQDNRTIVAFQNGFSAMEKMIVVIIAMNCQKIALFVKLKLISSARTIAAFPNNGLVILLTTVEMVQMNLRHSAKENIANALNQNSVAITENAFQVDGDVTMKTIAAMDQTNFTVKTSSARTEHSNVNLAIASLHTSVVMVIVIVAICLMKLIVHLDSLAVVIVLKRDSNVTTTSVSLTQTFAMARMIVVIIQMKHRLSVQI